MGKKDVKNSNRQKQKDETRTSPHNVNEGREQQVSHDRSARHLREIDRREGEMNHGETGGNFRQQEEPDNRA